MEEFYDLQTLPNGVRIVTEHVPAVRSACLGLWVGTGSRHEKAGEGGAAHFIEHMAYKGTERRTARQLAQEMDAIGGQINAYTTKECTCFYARCLDDHLDRAADILCDMVFHSRFDEGDVQTERGVILEEIGMYEDNPEDLCAERLSAAVYRGTPLGRPILGRKATLDKMTGAWLKDYMTEHYRPENLVVALAGSFSPLAVEELKARFGTRVYGVDVSSLEEVVEDLLREKGLTLGCAESITGGLMAKRLTDIPGSSQVFRGGVVSYTNEVKAGVLGVPQHLLDQFGAVSPEVARAMADGARRLLGCDIALSATGVAGPGKDEWDHEVGTAFVAISTAEGAHVRALNLGSRPVRARLRTQTAHHAFDLARRYLSGLPFED